ncbi:unnamed protein product [Zymoseptoria tritici ST99CH_1E4]|uniref:Mitochondrial carrier protein n=1 Tax=Zymoseptoria tritici ST99CH_1E4 TaxID=1276532 RepID=A0A2H1H7Y6_ZYMTR|nr:unnamed protein product [Zymoseptoria tritici ST99CH_1E4]
MLQGSSDGASSVAVARDDSVDVNAVKKKKRKEHGATGFYAASMRAISARALTFWFRAPAKAFFRSRIDYMGYARAINPHVRAGESWSWRMTSPALLYSAVQRQGWKFFPNQLLPPLLANTAIGAALYTAYLQTLGMLHEPSSRPNKRIYPPPSFQTCFAAGMVAGTVQSLFAAPLDALQTRFQSSEMQVGKYRDMWQYARLKLLEIGPRGIFAGWSLSLARDSLGSGFFFATFEVVKSQAFYGFVSTYYGSLSKLSTRQRESISAQQELYARPEIRPHYMVEPTFLLLAGATASIAQALVHHPVSRIQDVHYRRLEWIDGHSHAVHQSREARLSVLKVYAQAYRKTARYCLVLARRAGGLRQWVYRDFWLNTLRQVPSTSAGLIVFEIVRRKYASEEDAVRIPKGGYDIVLF